MYNILNDNPLTLKNMSEEKNPRLMSVFDLLGKHFLIPCYQRGYRWSKQQVNDLLNDILEFSKNKQDGDFYCLQPVVITSYKENGELKHDGDGNIWYEVIDGQQRLTTISLIIHYFNEMWVGKKKTPEPKLDYETREESAVFIKSLELVDSGANSSQMDANIDFYYISEAYKEIGKWVELQKDFDECTFQSVFKYNTQVIWYEVSTLETDPIKTFNRINLGKIPLTNSELIKALFLRKRNFGTHSAKLRQIEIASEWDQMEYALQDDKFWYLLNKDIADTPVRIEYLFNIMYEVAQDKATEKEFNKEYGTDSYATFRFFALKFSVNDNDNNIQDIWNEIKEYFLTLKELYLNSLYYHYVGFLIYCGKSTVADIYSLYHNNTKIEFEKKLKNHIKEAMEFVDYSNGKINLPYCNANKQKIRNLLLFFNIEYIVRKSISKDSNVGERNSYLHFPFDLFKKESWDIEHVDSYTENEIKKDDRCQWIKYALEDLGNELTNEERETLEKYTENVPDDSTFLPLKEVIQKKVGEQTNDEKIKNSIGNLTLLDSATNRSYGNALFPTKQRIIINKDIEGQFIPICTKHVFLKYFDLSSPNRTKWNDQDINKYHDHMVEILKDFLTEK